MFVHMPRDKRTAQLVAEDMALLTSRGVPVQEVKVGPAPLTPSLLHEAVPEEVTREQSEAIYKALQRAKQLDEQGMLVANPRSSGWRKVLIKAQVPGVSGMRLEDDASPVSELLNLLYAGHEIVSSTTTQMLDWWEAQLP